MFKKLKTYLKFYLRFPFISAIKLSTRYSIGSFVKVKLPNYKFPIHLRKNSTDFKVFSQVFLDNEYNIKFNKNSQVIIDGGANIGLFTVKVKNEMSEVKVICIEPDSDNLNIARKNLANYSNVYFEHAGLWNKDVKLKVYDKYKSGKWGMVVEEDNLSGNIDAISINSLLLKYKIDIIDVLKLDIESSEKQVFSENYENWLPKVKLIIIEFHDGFVKGCSKTFFEAINKTFNDYSLSIRGENIVIKNNDLK